jgi:hypothetical protein
MDGGLRTKVSFAQWVVRVSSGAKPATKKPTTTSPKTALLRRQSRRAARRRGVSTTSLAAMNFELTATSTMFSGAQSRVDEDIGDIDKQIEHDVDRCCHQNDPFNDGVVAIEDAVEISLPKPGS